MSTMAPRPAPATATTPSTADPAPTEAARAAFDPADWPVAWMARAERQHARNATALLAPHGLHHREFRLLAFLGRRDGMSVGDLAEAAVLERPTVSKMVTRLEAEGWIARSRHDADLRRAPLSLTDAGRAKLAAAVPVVEDLFRRYQAGIGLDERQRFLGEVRNFYSRVREVGRTAAGRQAPGLPPDQPATR
jgi:DNA-binding MarR family transcriptional regulator